MCSLCEYEWHSLNMHRVLFFVCVGICSIPISVHAQLNITEIMYDPAGTDAGHEWIEIYNSGSSPITVTEWKFLENAVNHGIVEHRGGSTIPAGVYAIIADNPANVLADIPTYAGIIFDSAFSLNNTGEIIALVDESGSTTDSVTYTAIDGASGSGGSLQKNSQNVWQSATATPGNPFASSTISGGGGGGSSDNDGGGSSGTGNGGTVTGDTGNSGSVNTTGGMTNTTVNSGPMGTRTPPKEKPKDYYDPYYTGTLKIPNQIMSGVATSFELELIYHVYDHEPTKRKSGRFVWNMGDGTEYTQHAIPHVEHTYMHAGTYIMVLDFFTSPEFFDAEPALHFEVPVEINTSDVQISGVDTDGTIMIYNGLDEVVNISDWKIEYATTTFVFPRNSFIAQGETLLLHSTRTKFVSLSEDTYAKLTLKYPDNTVHSSFKKVATTQSQQSYEEDETDIPLSQTESEEEFPNTVRSDLGASVISAIPLETKTSSIPTWLWIVIGSSLALSMIGITLSHFWGRKEVQEKTLD